MTGMFSNEDIPVIVVIQTFAQLWKAYLTSVFVYDIL